MPSDDFYIGYEPKAPPSIARVIARVVIALFAIAIGIAVVLVLAQEPFPQATFEFGVRKDFSGVIEARPYPSLTAGNTWYLLSAPGKHAPNVEQFDARRVRLRGSLIERDGWKMIEIEPPSVTEQAGPVVKPVSEEMGTITAAGEIVDSKCFLGVMNPGSGVVHRDCAVRCLSGGLPPLLVTREGNKYVLTGVSKETLLELAARPVEVRGRAFRSADRLLLDAESVRLRE